jgi:hypothetical protein
LNVIGREFAGCPDIDKPRLLLILLIDLGLTSSDLQVNIQLSMQGSGLAVLEHYMSSERGV